MKLKSIFLICLLLSTILNHVAAEDPVNVIKDNSKKNPNVNIGYLTPVKLYSVHYANALESLLKSINQQTTVRINVVPVMIQSLDDERLFECPFLYFNLGHKLKWEWTESEKGNLKKYLERGGFIYIDAGIKADFLKNSRYQNHSFAEWKPSKELVELFADIFPNKKFKPLPKTHEIFKTYKPGLPDDSKLPLTVKDFVIKEKWPGGTYSIVGMKVKKRLAIIASPIVAMGWGRTPDGRWSGNIMLRIRESGKDLSNTLNVASYDGNKFAITKEDGTNDFVFVKSSKPAWVHEGTGKWRLYKYYGGNEINDFTHKFFTQLGTNIIFYSLTH
ncbi:MAG: hypothetical protein COA79_25020 [Planctomycetota bacterium]|nr:MAG: hypothetical protein COA79_25020 [Planctomycetota bacterium]